MVADYKFLVHLVPDSSLPSPLFLQAFSPHLFPSPITLPILNMSAQARPIFSQPAPTTKPRSIRFSNTDPTNPRPQSMITRSITTRPMSSVPSIIRRSTTICPTIDVKQRRIVGRAPPVAQFDIITPPKSPTRLPQRTKSMNTNAASRNGLAGAVPRRIPSVSVTEARDFAVASMNSAVRRTQRTSQKPEREPQRRPPLQIVVSPGLERPMKGKVHPVGNDPGLPKYPLLTPGERDVLMHKLRVLLKCIDVDSAALGGWEESIPQDAGPNDPGTFTTFLRLNSHSQQHQPQAASSVHQSKTHPPMQAAKSS